MTYEFTNESLEAIMLGLSIEKNDKVISICSSGAQPLALLENIENGEVLAVDNNPEQIKFTKEVVKLIRNKKFTDLKRLNLAPKEEGYFADRKRINKISDNLKKIKFLEMDVYKRPQIKDRFTKGYFSNTTVNLTKWYSRFEKGALIYITYASTTLPNNIPEFLKVRKTNWEYDFKDMYEIDEERTRVACKIEKEKPGLILSKEYYYSTWTPCVFRKI